jgi:adenosylhomocysteine nucleosidase
MKLLFVAADRMEFHGLMPHLTQIETVHLAVDWSRRARLAGNDAMLVANGAGGERSAAAVDARIAGFRPEAVVSMGFCGALVDQMRIADVVIGTSIVGRTEVCSVPANVDVRCGPICSIDHVAGTAVEKRRLAASGAIAVEMEACGVAQRAAAHGIPIFVVKAVTDLAGETMANDFNRALRSDGHFATMKVLTGALRHPTARIPELIRLKNRCVRAARVLGDFIADCRF